jgi:hypothetical protein
MTHVGAMVRALLYSLLGGSRRERRVKTPLGLPGMCRCLFTIPARNFVSHAAKT